MIASGCFSFARDLAGLLDLRRVGGIVTRSITLHPTRGSAATRMAETPSGLLSAVGLQNPGVDAFQAELAALGKLGVPLFASVAGTTVEEYMRVAAKLVSLRLVAGIELNLSCPNAARDGQLFACEPDQAAQAVSAVSGVSRVPVFAKLSSETADIVGVARACIAAGARGLTLINTIPGMAIDVETQRPKLAAVTGGLSGPAIRPIAVHAVFRVARALPNVPILGVGGIVNERDALEFLGVGAWAVQVGTAMFANPAAPVEIALGIGKHLVAQGLAGPAELRGRATAVAAS
jgi:dihydroorotate dehydrogenase (NAD+) catalytic subunit